MRQRATMGGARSPTPDRTTSTRAIPTRRPTGGRRRRALGAADGHPRLRGEARGLETGGSSPPAIARLRLPRQRRRWASPLPLRCQHPITPSCRTRGAGTYGRPRPWAYVRCRTWRYHQRRIPLTISMDGSSEPGRAIMRAWMSRSSSPARFRQSGRSGSASTSHSGRRRSSGSSGALPTSRRGHAGQAGRCRCPAGSSLSPEGSAGNRRTEPCGRG